VCMGVHSAPITLGGIDSEGSEGFIVLLYELGQVYVSVNTGVESVGAVV
jgi:hypothetical protein